MVRKQLVIILISLIVLVISSILTWLIFFSIYEVKFVYNFSPKNLQLNSTYCVECVGLNSLGQEIKYRNFGFNIKLELNEEKILIIGNELDNKICFKTLLSGETSFELSSKYSLNPSQIKIKINKQ